MAHTVNLGDSLVKTELDAKHVGVGFIKVIADDKGDFHYERLDPASVIIKTKEA